jgi:hypothetical protein
MTAHSCRGFSTRAKTEANDNAPLGMNRSHGLKTRDTYEPLSPEDRRRTGVRALVSIATGVLITLAVRGYRFGESNHAVYLVDAVRRLDPSLLANDWWVQSTLQYHFVFNALTAALMRLGILEPVFLAGYLLLAVLLHVGWRRLTLALGGTNGTYLVSVVLYYVLAGGVGLGMYHFLQDSAFLPSNIANVAMLWAIVFWVAGRPALAGGAFGIAGLFHINHALAGIGLWAAASAVEWRNVFTRSWWVGTAALVALSAVQIVPAVRLVLARSGKLPLAEFVDLFVRLRHPHHFDPRAWHWGVWLAFLLPMPFAALAVRRAPIQPDARRRLIALVGLYAAMTVLALSGAGFWFASETLVQLNLYRFSIYLKLLSCIGLAWLVWNWNPRARAAVICGMVLFAAGAGVIAATSGLLAPPTARNPLGLKVAGLEGDGGDYLGVARWARDNTPAGATFLVPPDEESFRVHARRAIVVNFKGVPQLSAELPEWRDRLRAVLDLDTPGLLALPRPLGRTLRAMRAQYDALPPAHHAAVAARYDARYVLMTRPAPPAASARLVHSDSNGRYFLYDLRPEGERSLP